MRVFISADIEGVSGIANLPSTGPWRFEWAQGRSWMTNEVLAAIEGARNAGAREFVVSDGHGSAHNLLIDRFPPDAVIYRGWPRPLVQMEGIQDGNYDAVLFIGHHAMAQSWHGVLAHSFTMTYRDIRLDGVSQSETTINALVAEQFGAPVVFASGDSDYLAHLSKFLPDIETVETQRPLGYTAVDCLTPESSCERIRAGAERGVRRRAEIGRIRLPANWDVEFDVNTRSQADMLEYLPWLERRGAWTIGTRVADAVELLRLIAFASFYQAVGVPRYGERKL